MKCPACGYIGFEAADRCPDCGADLKRVVPPAAPEDLALRLDEALEPPADLPLGPARGMPPRVRVRPAGGGRTDGRASDTDLPLFEGGDEAAGHPLAPLPAPRAPLAVRRTPPAVSRPKPRHAVTPPQADLDLEMPSDQEPARAAEGAMAGRTRPPGVARRLASAWLDAALLAGVNLAIVYFTLRVCRLTGADIALLPPVPLLIFLGIVSGGYLWAFTAGGGQTIGKMAVGLRAVDRLGAPLSARRAAVRAVLSLVACTPLGLGLLPCLLAGGRRALHDWIAGTTVERVADR